MSRRRRWWLRALFGLVSVVLVGVVMRYGHDCGWLDGRLSWSCVAWSNIEEFRAQIAPELPRGTPQRAVEDYLVREEIPFSYSYPRYPSYRKPILIEKDLPGGRGNLFDGWMQLFIVFDHDGAVAEIEFHEQRK
jgi:hypothetical protein